MTFTVKVHTFNGETDTYSFSNIADAIKRWSKVRKVARVGRSLNILESGDYLIVNTCWTYNYVNENIGDWYKYQSKNTYQIRESTSERRMRLTVTSDEYPYSIINGEAVCLLSRHKPDAPLETAAPAGDHSRDFYLARFYWQVAPEKEAQYRGNNSYDRPFLANAPCGDYVGRIADVTRLCPLFRDDMVTVAVLGALFSRAVPTGNVIYHSPSQVRLEWAIFGYHGWFPFIMTPTMQHENVFTPAHIVDDLCALLYQPSNTGAFEQVITLHKDDNPEVAIIQRVTTNRSESHKFYRYKAAADSVVTLEMLEDADDYLDLERDIFKGSVELPEEVVEIDDPDADPDPDDTDADADADAGTTTTTSATIEIVDSDGVPAATTTVTVTEGTTEPAAVVTPTATKKKGGGGVSTTIIVIIVVAVVGVIAVFAIALFRANSKMRLPAQRLTPEPAATTAGPAAAPAGPGAGRRQTPAPAARNMRTYTRATGGGIADVDGM